ncbi:MAG: hypothetical protein F4Z31_06085 [Gemmatimonadetes bacterium]|nr:hypothetical protein [Gemmatimonadota bacterium]MYJ10621.1 hypothetical protein [Gemmatimonadota bacterium]
MSRAPVALLVAAACAPGLLMLADGSEAFADPSSPGPVSSGSYDAAVSFADLEYPVPFYGRLFTSHANDNPAAPEATADFATSFFGEVATDMGSDDLDLSFKVEGQSLPPGYRLCHTRTACSHVSVRITDEGLLYLHVPWTFHYLHLHLGDFPTRPVELSASDDDTDLKVYREVLVTPPTAATGCEDYGENNPDAYTCLFLREVIPEGLGGSESTLRAGLPDLVQDAGNYSLVFAEEFDGTPPDANAAGCRDGLSTLDDTAWVYYDACDIVDSLGEPCGNVADGSLVMADSGRCSSGMLGTLASFGLATYGKVHAKYGYLEVKYTFNLEAWPGDNNFNLVMFTRGTHLRFLTGRYGVAIDDWEDLLRNTDIEIDVFEYLPRYQTESAHQYANWGRDFGSGLVPIASNKRIDYCSSNALSIIANPDGCGSIDTFTVTKGIEWTPGGYRTFTKVDGFQNSLTLVPKDKIEIQNLNRAGNRVTLTGAQRDRYFGYVDPDDTGTLLEQVAVSHMPLPISLGVWGKLGPSIDPIRTRMKIDYVRFWQPEDHYANMEPVYQ